MLPVWKSRTILARCHSSFHGIPALVFVEIFVRGLPDPNQARDDFERLCSAMIKRYVAQTDGHAFVLFTSYEMIRRVARDITPWLASNDLALYSQADGVPRSQMIERFKANRKIVRASFTLGLDPTAPKTFLIFGKDRFAASRFDGGQLHP